MSNLVLPRICQIFASLLADFAPFPENKKLKKLFFLTIRLKESITIISLFINLFRDS